MDSLQTDNIDLPALDSLSGNSSQVLQDAEVVAHLLNGKNIKGQLKLLSYGSENYLLNTEDGPHSVLFSETLYLIFTSKMPVQSDNPPESDRDSQTAPP